MNSFHADVIKELSEMGKLGIRGTKKAIEYVKSHGDQFRDEDMSTSDAADLAIQLGGLK